MGRNYYTLDVFTKTVLSGNPLGVVLDTQGLETAQMQAIAAEFNLSETVFVERWNAADNVASIRIFTPKAELPFAGHPTVGTAILLASLDGLADGAMRQLILEEKVGPVACSVSREGGDYKTGFELPKIPVRRKLDVSTQQIADALGLDAVDIGLPGHEAAVCDAGNAMPVVPLSGLAAMEKIKVSEAALEQMFEPLGIEPEIYVYTKECISSDCHYHSRLFAPAMGITEDPATGSAAAALIAQIMACDRPEDGVHKFNIEQGLEMGRPSRIELSMSVKSGKVERASIAGNAVIIAKGELFI